MKIKKIKHDFMFKIITSLIFLCMVGCTSAKVKEDSHYDPPHLHKSVSEITNQGNYKFDDSAADDCITIIDSAHDALQRKDDEIVEINEELRLVTADRDETIKKLVEAQNKLDDIWHNPFFLVGVGLLGGILIMR